MILLISVRLVARAAARAGIIPQSRGMIQRFRMFALTFWHRWARGILLQTSTGAHMSHELELSESLLLELESGYGVKRKRRETD